MYSYIDSDRIEPLDPDNKGILKSRSPYLSSQAPVGSKGSENQEFSIDTYPQNTSNQYLSYPPSLQQSPASKMNKMIMSAPINIANNARPAPISRSNRSTSKTLPIIDTKIASVTSNRSDGDVATSNTKRKDLAIMKLAISERRTLLGRKGVSPILPRSKCHWDLVLDEMQWMAIDYRQELRWKISNAQAIAELCKTGIQERFQQRSQNESIRQVASDISGRVSAFWNSVRSDLGRSNEVTTPCGTPEIEKLDLNIVDVMSGYLQVFRNIDNECPEISCIDDKNNSHENARKRIDSLICRDFGVLIHGASGTGKTRFAVSMISSFYKSYKDLLLIVPRQRTLRWISELESISELRVLYVRDSEILFQSNSPSVYICPLELLLSSDMRKKILPKFSCVFLDFRCPSSHMWNCTGKLSKYWRCRLLDLISPHLISQCNRCIIDSSFPSDDWKPYLRFCLPRSVVFSKPFESWLNCQTSEFTAYVVKCVSARLVVDERMELQIKEEILSMEMDSLQHLKYIQVIENLLHQSAFTGDNPWVLAQALTLLRRACFHEAFVSVGLGRQRALPAPQTQNTYYSSINPYQNMYGNNSQYINGVGLGFGVGTGSFYSGVQYFSSQPCIQPSAEGFSEVIMNDYDEEGIDGLRSRFFDSGILRHMRTCHFSSRHDDGNSNNYINSGLHGSSMMDSTSSVTFTIPAMVTCFAPGPLAAKLSSPPKFNMNGNFYDSIGSCKLQALCKLLTRYAGLHIVVTVFTDDEQLAVHHFLNRLGYDHIVAGILGNRFSDSMSLEGGSASLVWLKTQLAVSQFNKIPSANNAILVTTSRIFKDDDLIPYAADVVIILSDDWLTPVDIKRHYRLRLRKNGAPKDPVTIMRLVAKGTLEEIVVRKGSLLNLQGSGLNDVLSLSPQYVQMYSHLSHKILVRAPLLSFQNIKEEFKIESDNNSSESSTTKNLSIPRHGDLSHYNPSAQIWLREVEFGVEYAEFQFSRMGKYMPYSLIRKEANNKYLTNPIDPLIQAQSSVQNSGSQPLSSSIEAKKSAIVFDLMRNESGGEIVSNAVSDAILSTYLHSNKKFGIKGLNIFARLLGFMVRDYLNSKEDDLYHVTLSKPGRNSSPLLMNCKWKSVGLGGNRAEKLFYSMNQIPGDSLQPGHRDASMLSLQVYGGSLSRSCQFFRNLQSFSRRIGQNIDPLLYLNPLNNADLYELVLRPSYCQQSDHFSFPLSIKYYIKPTTTKTVKKVGSKPTRADVQSLARKRLLDSSLVVDARRKRIMLLSSSGTRPDEYNNVDCDSLSQLSSGNIVVIYITFRISCVLILLLIFCRLSPS